MRRLVVLLLASCSLQSAMAQQPADDILLSTSAQPLSLKQLISDTNAIYFVDLWASWCGPCMAEMPNSVRLRKRFAGKPVKFLYLSIDQNPRAWLNAASQLSEVMDSTNTFLFQNFAASGTNGKYKVEYIPRYLLFDGYGRVLDREAPRPGSDVIHSVINKELRRLSRKKN